MADRNRVSCARRALATNRNGINLGCRHVSTDRDGTLSQGARSRHGSRAEIDRVHFGGNRLEADRDAVLHAGIGAGALGNGIGAGRCSAVANGDATISRSGCADARRQ